MIQVTFGTLDIKWVQSIEWSSELEPAVMVNTSTKAGHRVREITLTGFVHNGDFENSIALQQSLEADLIAVGTGTIAITGATDIEDCRFLGLSIDEFRGNPITNFEIRFVTEASNVHAHSTVRIGSITLTESAGYEQPAVTDTIGTQGPDEQLKTTARRSFKISGTFVGATTVAINTTQSNLETEVANKTTLTIQLTTGIYTVRPRELSFGVPANRDPTTARTYSFDCTTHDDYSLEPYTLGEVAASYGGIQIDVVTAVNYDTDYERDGSNFYYVQDESLTVTGKKYFDSWTAYTTFRDTYNPIPIGSSTLISTSTGNILQLTDVGVSEFKRDGNSTAGPGNKRYAANVTLEFRWVKTYAQNKFETGQTRFGVLWLYITSTNFGANVDSFGNSTGRNISLTGTLGQTAYNNLVAKVGTSENYDTSGGYDNMYITSISVNSRDETKFGLGPIATGVAAIYNVTVTASQLETAAQAGSFLRGLFEMDKVGAQSPSPYAGTSFEYDNITNRSKSISNRYDGSNFVVTQMSLTYSGEVWEADSGSAPANPNRIYTLFNQLDSLLAAARSDKGVNSHGGTVALPHLLPQESTIHYMLNSFSVGNWTPFVKPTGTGAGDRYWKQTVSVTATAVFDLSGSSSAEPDLVETKSFATQKESPKYKQLQVLGFGTVFKRVGTTPEKTTVTFQARWRNEQLYQTANPVGSALSFPNKDVSLPAGSPLIGKSVITKEFEENRGLTNRAITEYTANEKVS